MKGEPIESAVRFEAASLLMYLPRTNLHRVGSECSGLCLGHDIPVVVEIYVPDIWMRSHKEPTPHCYRPSPWQHYFDWQDAVANFSPCTMSLELASHLRPIKPNADCAA